MTRIEVFFIFLFAGIFGLLLYGAHQNDVEWQAFKQQHHCKVTAHVDGDSVNTIAFGSNGQPVVGIATTPDKTGWTCDDGITYFK